MIKESTQFSPTIARDNWIKAVGKRILVQPLETTQGAGLIIAHKKPTQFAVISIGDEVTKVSVGDTIYLEKLYGVEIEHDKEKYLVIDESSILAKVVSC